jgi:hypothetical protein
MTEGGNSPLLAFDQQLAQIWAGHEKSMVTLLFAS